MPPQNTEAEQSFLGCLLIDKDSIIKVADMVTNNDFYNDRHRIIYEAITTLYARQEPIDILTLTDILQSKNQLEKIGGRAYLAHLSNSVTSAAHVESYASIIQKKATLRRLLEAASNISSLGYNEDSDVDALLDEAERKLFGVSQKYLKNNFTPVDQLLNDAFERIDELHRHGGRLRGVPTGFKDLDGKLAGLQKSDLIILAARPSVGKTSLALDMARQIAVNTKTAVGVFSLEMSKEQLVDRMLCAQANVNLWKMRTGKLSDREDDNDFVRIGDAMGKLSEAPVFIDDSPNCSIMEIRTKARRLQIEKNLGVLIIDYLQLMEGRGKYSDNRVQEISEISRGLKGIARELNIPVLALSQLSRAVEQNKPAIPKLAHLRESGSIEQDADVVMFIYRKAADRSYNREELSPEERNKAEIHIAKHRNGPTGVVNLFFHEETASYKNLSSTDFGEQAL